MKTKTIAVLIIASVMLLCGTAFVSGADYAVWCKDAQTGTVYCGYSSSSSAYCYVDQYGGWASPPVTPCSWGGAGWRFSSTAYATGKTCNPSCPKVGGSWAEAYAAPGGCYCRSG